MGQGEASPAHTTMVGNQIFFQLISMTGGVAREMRTSKVIQALLKFFSVFSSPTLLLGDHDYKNALEFPLWCNDLRFRLQQLGSLRR